MAEQTNITKIPVTKGKRIQDFLKANGADFALLSHFEVMESAMEFADENAVLCDGCGVHFSIDENAEFCSNACEREATYDWNKTEGTYHD